MLFLTMFWGGRPPDPPPPPPFYTFICSCSPNLGCCQSPCKCFNGEWQRGESWALKNILNPTSGSQDLTVNSPYVQISLKTDCICVTSSKRLVLICICMNLLLYLYNVLLSFIIKCFFFNIYTITVTNQCMLIQVLNISASTIILLMLTRVTTTPNRGAPLRTRLQYWLLRF